MSKQYVISMRTIVLTLLLILSGYVVYRLSSVFGILFISLLIVFSIESLIKFLSKITFFNRPLGRNISVIISYALLVLMITLILTTGIPPLVSQLQKLLNSLSKLSFDIHITDKLSLTLADLLPSPAKFSTDVIAFTFSLFSNITDFISILIISIYMSFDWENIKQTLISFLPDRFEEKTRSILSDVEFNVGQWVKGELFLMFAVGFLNFIGFMILDVKYALALSIIAGLLEAVPMIGPIIATIIASIVGFADSPIKGLGCVASGTIVQQLENNILVPKIMEKVSGFSPLIILMALLIGSEFFGVVGAILAVPMTMVLSILLKRLLLNPEE